MRLLISAVAARDEPARGAWEEWLAAVDFERLEDGATPLLSLVGTDAGDLRTDPAIAGRIRGVHRQTWARNRLLWAAGAPLVDRLGEAGATALLLPAAALLPAYDGDWGARPFERIHLALPLDAVDLAHRAMAGTGWAVEHVTPTLLARTRGGFVERWESQDAAGNRAVIRWHVLRRVRSSVADEQLRGAAERTTLEGSAVLLLHPADALLERLWNGAAEWGPGWIVDAVQLARRLDPEGGRARRDVDRFAARARALAVLPSVRRRLELVASVVPDPAVVAALDALRATRPGVASRLWSLPGPAAGRGRVWAGHAAGQGVARGARSLARSRWAARRIRQELGSAQRR